MVTISPLGRAALRYAERCVHVFPLIPGDRVPLRGSRGFHDATADMETVARWWREDPDRNIGCALEPSELLVLDVDHHGVVDGHEALAALGDEGCGVPPTATAETPRGGLHVFFRRPAGLDLRDRIGFRPGLDVLVLQVVLAPSVRRDGPYRWTTRGIAPAPAPSWLLAAAQRPISAPLPATRAAPVTNSTGYLASCLRRACGEAAAATDGARDCTLARVCYGVGGLLHLGGLGHDEAFAALVHAGTAAGLSEAQARGTVSRGLDRGARAPRSIALRCAEGTNR